jgi:hypothetical protein
MLKLPPAGVCRCLRTSRLATVSGGTQLVRSTPWATAILATPFITTLVSSLARSSVTRSLCFASRHRR